MCKSRLLSNHPSLKGRECRPKPIFHPYQFPPVHQSLVREADPRVGWKSEPSQRRDQGWLSKYGACHRKTCMQLHEGFSLVMIDGQGPTATHQSWRSHAERYRCNQPRVSAMWLAASSAYPEPWMKIRGLLSHRTESAYQWAVRGPHVMLREGVVSSAPLRLLFFLLLHSYFHNVKFCYIKRVQMLLKIIFQDHCDLAEHSRAQWPLCACRRRRSYLFF